MVREVPTIGRRRVAGAVALLALALVAVSLVPPGGATPTAPRPAADYTPVVWVSVTPPLITEQGRFTVAMDLASSTNVSQVYFTFCQLTSSLCYAPIAMTRASGNLYVGATLAMSHYSGMKVGIRGGVNITIAYNDSATQNEPALPNSFHNLTIAQSVTGENMYLITVGQLTYGLSGRVVDSVTGAAVAGATVSVNATNVSAVSTGANGQYAFSSIPNGTYTLTVTKSGYPDATSTVSVAGSNATQDVTLTGTSSNHPTPSHNTSAPLLSGWVVYALTGAVIAVILGIVVVMVYRRRGAGASPPAGG